MTLTEKTVQYFQGAYKELKNITWPSQKEIKQHTLLVIGISLGVAIFLGLADYILTMGIEQIINLVK
jgi:preprotein translocase SecE subunit